MFICKFIDHYYANIVWPATFFLILKKTNVTDSQQRELDWVYRLWQKFHSHSRFSEWSAMRKVDVVGRNCAGLCRLDPFWFPEKRDTETFGTAQRWICVHASRIPFLKLHIIVRADAGHLFTGKLLLQRYCFVPCSSLIVSLSSMA